MDKKPENLFPKSEQWLYEKENFSKLERALKWSEKNKPIDNFDQLIKTLNLCRLRSALCTRQK